MILGATEFLAALFSKIVFKSFSRRVSLMLSFIFIGTCFFFLLVFKDNISTRYVVTLSSRAVLQILFNILSITTLE